MKRRSCPLTLLLLFVLTASASDSGDSGWSRPVAVSHRGLPCVTFRCKVAGEWLMVEMDPADGWHSFALDNKLRAEERLAGKKSLGIEMPTKIEAIEGLELIGPWLQPKPSDFSKPEMRWYTFGFDKKALLACKVRRTSKATNASEAASIRIKGQACNSNSCRNIDITIPIGEAHFTKGSPDLRGLEPVKTQKPEP